MKNQAEIPLRHGILFIFVFTPHGFSQTSPLPVPGLPGVTLPTLPACSRSSFQPADPSCHRSPETQRAPPGEKKPRLSTDGLSFSLSQLSIPSTFFCSDHSTGSACLSLSTQKPSGRSPVKTAWSAPGPDPRSVFPRNSSGTIRRPWPLPNMRVYNRLSPACFPFAQKTSFTDII